MKINVRLTVEVDLAGYATEYGLDNVGLALVEALRDLREPEWYLSQPKWAPLATVEAVYAYTDLNP